jgi:hypothetical protein
MIHKKLLSLLVLLIAAATGAWADIAQGDVFMFGSYIDFGTSVRCKLYSGGTDNTVVAKSTKLPLTYGGYENGKHQLVFNSANATSDLYIYDANSAKPWGIKVTGGEGTSGNPFTFSTVYDWPNNCPQELIIGTDGTCSFAMPASDMTVNYTLVRDMQDKTSPVAFTGLPTTTTAPIIVKKGSDGKYQPAEELTIQLIDPLAAAEAQNIIAADGITIKVLVGAENEKGAIEYDQVNPITLEAFLADMKPGYYWIKAVPTDETTSPYIGTVYSSEFTVVEKYDLTVKPANDFSKGKIESVTVGSGSVTIDANTGEATKTGIDPDTEVKIKAKRGYVIDKVEVKKTMKLLTLTVNGVTNKSIYYAEGDTWQQAIERPENAGSGWKVQGDYIFNGGLTLMIGSGYVRPGHTIDATKNYSLEAD